MPKPDNRSSEQRWAFTSLGLVPREPNSSVRDSEVRYGFKGIRNVDPYPYPPRPYLSDIAKGSITRAAAPAIATYPPSPMVPEALAFQDGLPQLITARNRSWDRLVEEVRGPSSQLGTTIAEGREAFELMATRLTSTYRAYKHLKRGNFREFLNELSVDPKRKHKSWRRTAGKEASGLWLEYWFGWSPMVADIYASLETTSDPSRDFRYACKGAASVRVPTLVGQSAAGGWRRVVTSENCKVSFKQGAEFVVSNPNVFLLNRLGLVNPLAIAWELVPFSFVVDWFTKVGSCINGYSDLWGTNMYDPWNVSFVRGRVRGVYTNDDELPPNRIETTWFRCRTNRQLGLARPVPIYPRIVNFGGSVTRAATAASLMAQILISD